jgi:addiction module HigA family antidote
MSESFIEVEHPGIILKEEFLEPYGINVSTLAKETGIDVMTISEIIKGAQRITPGIGLKIAKFLGLSDG